MKYRSQIAISLCIAIGVFASSIGFITYGAALIIGPIIYLGLRCFKRNKTEASDQLNGEIICKTLCVIFFVILAYSFFAFNSTIQGRPPEYIISILIISAILPLIVLTLPDNNKGLLFVVLGAIFALSISLRLSVYYAANDVIWDLWRHQELIEMIISVGRLPLSTDVATTYTQFPLMHILTANISLVTTLPIKDAIATSVNAFLAFSPVFVFLIGRYLLNIKIGLIAAFLLAITPSHILYGFLGTPQTLCLGIIACIFYLLFTSNKTDTIVIRSILALLFVFMTFTHNLSMLILVVALSLIYILNRIALHRFERFPIDVLLPLLAGIMFVFYYIYTGDFLLIVRSIQQWFELGSFSSFLGAGIGPSGLTLLQRIWDELYLSLLLVLILVGGFHTLHENNRKQIVLVGSGISLLSIAFLASITGFTLVLPYRWEPFALILLVTSAAIGFNQLCFNGKRLVSICSTVILGFILSITMLFTYSSNDASPNEYNLGFQAPYSRTSASELAAYSKVIQLSTGDQYIVIDYMPKAQYFFRNSTYEIYIRMPNILAADLFINQDTSAFPAGTMIVLRDKVRHYPFYVVREFSEGLVYVSLDYDPKDFLDHDLGFNMILSTGSVHIYVGD
ncbi:hypothetical protein ACFLXG_03250 [Chloroflexota bacterium]